MNKGENTKERICAFYASDYHFEMVSLPYISKEMDNQDEIIILTENNLEETIKKLLSKVNLNENKKKKILNLNWKNENGNKLKIIKDNIDKNKNTTIFVKGKEKYIKNTNKSIEKIIDRKENYKIINCYDIQEIGEKMEQIMSQYKKVLSTMGEKEIEKF